MTASVFDTLSYAKRLKAAGVPEAQAEVHAAALAEAVGGALVTRHDLSDAVQGLNEGIALSRHDLTEAMALSKRDLADAVRGLNDAIALIRRDLTEAMALSKRDLAEAVRGLNEAITLSRRDLSEAILKLEARITAGEGRTNLLQWMAGFNIALTVTILFKVFA